MRLALAGQRFGRLLVVSFSHVKGEQAYWNCQCDCGNQKVVAMRYLRTGHTKSCGCLNRELSAKRQFIHGGRNTRLFNTWAGMIQRCENQNSKSYRWYGARGIRMCPEWRSSFAVFREWALSHGYADGLTIDRIDSDGDYEPGNCQWLTRSENSIRRNARVSA